MLKETEEKIRILFAKSWVQWLMAILIILAISWIYMGRGVTSCSTNTVAALGGDSTGGIAWSQWAGGNDLNWGTVQKSNYPFGENLENPQNITSLVFLSIYKIFATLTSPICGLNLAILFGYMSTGLLMFGLVRWLLKRFDIAMFAAYAAAFVPFHVFKSLSHVNYVYGSTFIAVVWAFLWMLSRPSYRRAAIFGLISAIGFYFDGYFILFSGLLISTLVGGQMLIELYRILRSRKNGYWKGIKKSLERLRYPAFGLFILALLLLPIAAVFLTQGERINQSLALVRSDIKVETLTYGARPIELILPGANNPLMPESYPALRGTLLHNSNYSESTLYAGFVVLILALISVGVLIVRKRRNQKIQRISYKQLVFLISFAAVVCFLFSFPAYAHIFGRSIPTPSLVIITFTASWRVLSRIFLVVHPLLVLLACLGLWQITRPWRWVWRVSLVILCCVILALEYLPSPLGHTDNVKTQVPLIYQQLAREDDVDIVAEYPLADFTYTPSIFTFQPAHNKTLVNAANASVTRGPFAASIAGINDDQSLPVLYELGVDRIITHGFQSNNPFLKLIYRDEAGNSNLESFNLAASSYGYGFTDLATGRNDILVIDKGYESLSVDDNQISHRFVTKEASMSVFSIDKSKSRDHYNVKFTARSNCDMPAMVMVMQDGQTLWQGEVDRSSLPIQVRVANKEIIVRTARCAIGITQLNAFPL